MKPKPFLLRKAEAMQFVEKHHANQMYGEFPYHFHLYQVCDIAVEFGLDEEQQIAALLHDTGEDSSFSFNKIARTFRTDVARLVYLVTDEKGWDRTEKHARTYPLLANDRRAVGVKLCDNIGNRRFSIATCDTK